ncbi:hypothetical protein FI460_07310 [Campylobacter coli]|nr:hypothetical protein [Campylobacter coli]
MIKISLTLLFYINIHYEVAVVGSPDKEYLWILSRKIIDKKEIDKLLDIAKQKGFDISDIVFDKY